MVKIGILFTRPSGTPPLTPSSTSLCAGFVPSDTLPLWLEAGRTRDRSALVHGHPEPQVDLATKHTRITRPPR